jgi:hypothetical protein
MSGRLRILCVLLVVVPGLVFAQYGRPRRTRSIGPNNGVPDGPTPLVTMRGTLRSINKKDVVIDAGEDQIVTLKRVKKTKFLKGTKEITPDDFPDAAAVVIEASRAMNGDFDAINVFLGEPPGSDKEDKKEAQPPPAESAGPK